MLGNISPKVMQHNALLGWDLLWYLPLAYLTLFVWVPDRVSFVWADFEAVRHFGWKLLIMPWPIASELLYLSILPMWVLVFVPRFFARTSENVFFRYRRCCVLASYFLAGGIEYLVQALIYIYWPTCLDSSGQERVNLFTALTGLPVNLLFGCFPNRPVALSTSEFPEILVFVVLAVIGLVALVYFAKAGKKKVA